MAEALLRAVERDPNLIVTVDVERKVVEAPGAKIRAEFPLDDFTQHRLLEGLDDIGLTLTHEDAVLAYEAKRASWLPSVDTAAV